MHLSGHLQALRPSGVGRVLNKVFRKPVAAKTNRNAPSSDGLHLPAELPWLNAVPIGDEAAHTVHSAARRQCREFNGIQGGTCKTTKSGTAVSVYCISLVRISDGRPSMRSVNFYCIIPFRQTSTILSRD
jgi:hypothetical protein